MVRQTKTPKHIDKSLGTSSSSAHSILFHGGSRSLRSFPLDRWSSTVLSGNEIDAGNRERVVFDLFSFINMGYIKYYFGDVLTPCGPLFVSSTGDEDEPNIG